MIWLVLGTIFAGFLNLVVLSYLIRKIQSVEIIHSDINEFRQELITLASQRKRRF